MVTPKSYIAGQKLLPRSVHFLQVVPVEDTYALSFAGATLPALLHVHQKHKVTGRKANEKQFALSNVKLIPIENLAYDTLG